MLKWIQALAGGGRGAPGAPAWPPPGGPDLIGNLGGGVLKQ